MSMASANGQVLQQLEHALETGHVPDEEKRRGAQLLVRLKTSVQVVLIGKPGSGKSRLINMLAGDAVIPDIPDLPPLEITYGSRPRTVYLMGDGSETALDGLQLDWPAPPQTAIIRAEMPLEVLKRLSLSEVTLEGSPSDQKTVVDWAMSRADIVLWCSQSFDASERALWQSAEETLKDHSFLVLTKADQLHMKGVLTKRIQQLEDVVADEFFRMYPVATIQAISALSSDGPDDENLWVSSGGKALSDAVNKLVDTGRSADADNALMFLSRNAPALPETTGADATAGTTARKAGASEPVQQAQTPTAPTVLTVSSGGHGDTSGATHQTINTQAFRDALEFLQNRADQMLRTIRENGSDKQAYILDHCLETANKLSEILMEVETAAPPLSDIQDDVMECGDMMVLFHLEKTEDAAEDAVTLLLQLKKEMAIAVST